MPDQRATSAERLVASLIAVPLGIGAALIDEIPTRAVTARERVDLARFVGKMVVDRAAQELRRRLGVVDDAPDDATPHAEPDVIDDIAPVIDHVPPQDLALPDYDQLPAAHIVSKLAGLTIAERADIEAYETAHRHRRTVLGKLDQLRSEGVA